MDKEVEEDSVTVEAGSDGMRVESVDQGEDMVIPVKEHQRTFAENKEDGVSELK